MEQGHPDDEIAARAAALHATPRPVGRGTSSVYHLPEAGLALKVHPAGTRRERLEAEAALSRRLAAAHVPAARIAGLAEVDGRHVTLWEWIEHDPETTASPGELGAVLRQYHEGAAGPPLPLGENREHGRFSTRAAALTGTLTADEVEKLTTRIAAVEGVLETTGPGEGIIHGDLHPGNVLTTRTGPWLVDYDRTCYGERTWDLAALAVAARRGQLSNDYLDEVINGYGAELDRELLERMARLRELSSIVWLAEQHQAGRRHDRAGLERRLATIDEPTARWEPSG